MIHLQQILIIDTDPNNINRLVTSIDKFPHLIIDVANTSEEAKILILAKDYDHILIGDIENIMWLLELPITIKLGDYGTIVCYSPNEKIVREQKKQVPNLTYASIVYHYKDIIGDIAINE